MHTHLETSSCGFTEEIITTLPWESPCIWITLSFITRKQNANHYCGTYMQLKGLLLCLCGHVLLFLHLCHTILHKIKLRPHQCSCDLHVGCFKVKITCIGTHLGQCKGALHDSWWAIKWHACHRVAPIRAKNNLTFY